jgi:hypothetical protein
MEGQQMKPQNHKLWPLFLRWCAVNQVNTEDHEEDWISLWETWKDGAVLGIKLLIKQYNKEGSYAIHRFKETKWEQ